VTAPTSLRRQSALHHQPSARQNKRPQSWLIDRNERAITLKALRGGFVNCKNPTWRSLNLVLNRTRSCPRPPAGGTASGAESRCQTPERSAPPARAVRRGVRRAAVLDSDVPLRRPRLTRARCVIRALCSVLSMRGRNEACRDARGTQGAVAQSVFSRRHRRPRGPEQTTHRPASPTCWATLARLDLAISAQHSTLTAVDTRRKPCLPLLLLAVAACSCRIRHVEAHYHGWW